MRKIEESWNEKGEHIFLVSVNDIPVMRLGTRCTHFVPLTLYLWWEMLSELTVCDLLFLRRNIDQLSGARYFCNVESKSETNMKFAKAFGFKELYRADGIAVLERNV